MEMQETNTVDCHSHTDSPKVYYENGPYNLFSFMAYFNREIEALGGKISSTLFREDSSDGDRWKVLRNILVRARNISYWRHNIVVYRNLFDFRDDELNDNNWQPLNQKIKESTADPNWYDRVTREVCKLETQIKNIPWFQEWEPQYFTAVLRMEPALDLCNPKTRKSLESSKPGLHIVYLGRQIPKV